MKLAHTELKEGFGYQVVSYYGTEIVEWNNSEIFLHTGGYETMSTVRRMNQVSGEFGLGFHVSKRDGRLVVEMADGRALFLVGDARITRV